MFSGLKDYNTQCLVNIIYGYNSPLIWVLRFEPIEIVLRLHTGYLSNMGPDDGDDARNIFEVDTE